jgi:hypothetical protein
VSSPHSTSRPPMRLNWTASRQSSILLHGTRLPQICGPACNSVALQPMCTLRLSSSNLAKPHVGSCKCREPKVLAAGTWRSYNHNHNHTCTNNDFRPQNPTSTEDLREIECCNETQLFMLRFSPKHSVSLSKYHEQNAFGSVFPCRLYDGYEATTNAQL